MKKVNFNILIILCDLKSKNNMLQNFPTKEEHLFIWVFNYISYLKWNCISLKGELHLQNLHLKGNLWCLDEGSVALIFFPDLKKQKKPM